MQEKLTRRAFVQTAAAGSAAVTMLSAHGAPAVLNPKADKPAVLGGTPVHNSGWPGWPEWREEWEPEVLEVLRSGVWSSAGGGRQVEEFEHAYAKLLGAKRCTATASGTTALISSIHVAGVEPGDEVITSPYTFIATYNTILFNGALPVFADTDPATLTMDPETIESRITDRTRAIVPVHIFGLPCDMDRINAIAKQHNLMVIEDACQAWLSEYKGRKCGTLGDLGCFSFQNSKHIPAGEGGAVTTDNEQLADRVSSFRNCGRGVGSFRGSGHFTRGANFRMQHFQGAMLLQQIDKLVKETARRQENADYLTAGLRQIPGILPIQLPENSRAVYHLYPFRYDSDAFSGLPYDKFVHALNAEGIPCGGVYGEQYYDGLLDEAIASRGFQRLFPAERLKAYRASFDQLKGNKLVCQTTVGMFQSMLLADRTSMDHIIEAIQKIHAHSAAIAKA